MPSHMPEDLGKYFVIKYYVDANHSVNMENRRSHSAIIIYVNNIPVIWYSKHHNIVEAYTFVLEFVSPRVSTEIFEALL